MTAWPALNNPEGMTRTLRVSVVQRMCSDMVTERIWINRHVQHIYDIPWPVLTDAHRILLETYYAGRRGMYAGDIAFVDPWDGLTYTCRFDQDELALQSSLPHFSGAIRLVEVSGFKAKKPAVASFPATVPFQAYSRSRRYSTVIGVAPNDFENRREDFGDVYGIQKWGVGGDALTDAQALDLLNCWEGNGGPWGEFGFMDPITSSVFGAHFVEPQIEHTLICSRGSLGFLHSIRATVEELRVR